ncbi:hypothetical protein [Bacillus sp. UNC41MFS5]|uniref:hypothetical protein n=1 Tax=Bacillus sp. UNC41MFS5 TaxID=1449046 RepID=UPI000478D866|nr:hypothetical protein [Bacillus sp. UNC41MFS5]
MALFRLNTKQGILIKRLVESDASTTSEAITTKGGKKIVEMRLKIPQEITHFSTEKDQFLPNFRYSTKTPPFRNYTNVWLKYTSARSTYSFPSLIDQKDCRGMSSKTAPNLIFSRSIRAAKTAIVKVLELLI